MILAFTGTRYLYPFQERAITRALEKIKAAGKVECVMTGACQGVDAFVALWFAENCPDIQNVIIVPAKRDYVNEAMLGEMQMGDRALIRYLPQPPDHRRSYAIRNQMLVDESDAVVAFWDGRSRGTKMTIEMAKKAGKDVKVIRI